MNKDQRGKNEKNGKRMKEIQEILTHQSRLQTIHLPTIRISHNTFFWVSELRVWKSRMLNSFTCIFFISTLFFNLARDSKTYKNCLK